MPEGLTDVTGEKGRPPLVNWTASGEQSKPTKRDRVSRRPRPTGVLCRVYFSSFGAAEGTESTNWTIQKIDGKRQVRAGSVMVEFIKCYTLCLARGEVYQCHMVEGQFYAWKNQSEEPAHVRIECWGVELV